MAAAKTKKAVNASDITHKAECWARHKKAIAKLERERDKDSELNAILARHDEELKPFVEKYDLEIEKLEDKATKIYDEVIAWLKGRKKSIVITSKSAIAELFRGSKISRNRVPNAEKFVAKCKERGLDPWKAVSVLIKDGEKLLGKTDFEAVCTKPKVLVEEATLTLKD